MFNRVKSCKGADEMQLFEIVEKNLPDMRRHLHALARKVPKAKRVDDDWKIDIGNQMVEWLWDEYLYDQSAIYQLFIRAGVHRKMDMASYLLIWTIWEDNLMSNRKVSRADTSPARE